VSKKNCSLEMLEQRVVTVLKLVLLILLVTQLLDLLLPWSEICLVDPSPGVHGACAELGLTRCIDGDLCKMMASTTTSANLPPWLKDTINRQTQESAIYNASMYSMIILLISIICNVSSEAVWLFTLPEKSLDYRILLKLASCGLFILSAVVYMALLHQDVKHGAFMAGTWLTLFVGIASLLVCAAVLTRLEDNNRGQFVAPEGNKYGTLPR